MQFIDPTTAPKRAAIQGALLCSIGSLATPHSQFAMLCSSATMAAALATPHRLVDNKANSPCFAAQAPPRYQLRGNPRSTTGPSAHQQILFRTHKGKSSCARSKLQQSHKGKAIIQPPNPSHKGRDQALSGVCGHSDKHAARKFLEAQCAFKISMIHEVLQFALRIAFRCVLHRCGNLDIRC